MGKNWVGLYIKIGYCLEIILILLLICGVLTNFAVGEGPVSLSKYKPTYTPNANYIPPDPIPGPIIPSYIPSTSTVLTNISTKASDLAPEPQITIIPENISFCDSDWQLDHGKRVTISIYNPEGCHIAEIVIKINLPDAWDIIPDVTPSKGRYYSPDQTTYLIEDFGFFKENSTTEWFEIKPTSKLPAQAYSMNLLINVMYHRLNGPPTETKVISKDLNLVLFKLNNSDGLDIYKLIAIAAGLCTIISFLLIQNMREKVKNLIYKLK